VFKKSWIVQNHGNDSEAIKVILSSDVDYSLLQDLKNASSLVEAPNTDKKPDIEILKKTFINIEEIKERNVKIVAAYRSGYSQHMIVLASYELLSFNE